MTAKELTLWQIAEAGKHIDRALDGLSDTAWDHKPHAAAMSPRETVEHLCECLEAFNKATRGEKHDWGNYTIADKSSDNLLGEYRKLRETAIANVSDSDEALKEAFMYITDHDAYHVGQICHVRLDVDPNWNMYSIYEG